MNATQANAARPEPRTALVVHSGLQLREHDLLALQLQPGDRLRSERGSVWITVDGDLNDIVLDAGQVHVVQATGAVNVSALGSAWVSVRSRAPLRWSRISPDQPGTVRRVLQRLAHAGMDALGFYNRPPAQAAGR